MVPCLFAMADTFLLIWNRWHRRGTFATPPNKYAAASALVCLHPSGTCQPRGDESCGRELSAKTPLRRWGKKYVLACVPWRNM